VEAVVATPLFSAHHKLVFPEGARLTGTVVAAKKARSFHRGGQLRFKFQRVDLPPEVSNLRPSAPRPEPMQTQAILADAEGNGTARSRSIRKRRRGHGIEDAPYRTGDFADPGRRAG
jgi:hypothetical protein